MVGDFLPLSDEAHTMPAHLVSRRSSYLHIRTALDFIVRNELRMAYIELPIVPELGREFPGIVGPMTFRPETAAPINELANILLRGESTLTRGQRELIATHVSRKNDCFSCQTISRCGCRCTACQNEKLVETVKTDWPTADISPKLKALLNIAGKVQFWAIAVNVRVVVGCLQIDRVRH
jgi:alkylhydroperoxidase family enzyme